MRYAKGIRKQVSRRGKATPNLASIKTPVMKQIELRLNHDIGEYIADKLNHNWTLTELAAVLQVKQCTVSRWVSKLIVIS